MVEGRNGSISEKSLKFLRCHLAITEDLQHETRSYYFSSMYGDNSNATIWMPQELVASFHTRNLKSHGSKCADDLFPGQSWKTAHDATRIVCTPTKSSGSKLSP